MRRWWGAPVARGRRVRAAPLGFGGRRAFPPTNGPWATASPPVRVAVYELGSSTRGAGRSHWPPALKARLALRTWQARPAPPGPQALLAL